LGSLSFDEPDGLVEIDDDPVFSEIETPPQPAVQLGGDRVAPEDAVEARGKSLVDLHGALEGKILDPLGKVTEPSDVSLKVAAHRKEPVELQVEANEI